MDRKQILSESESPHHAPTQTQISGLNQRKKNDNEMKMSRVFAAPALLNAILCFLLLLGNSPSFLLATHVTTVDTNFNVSIGWGALQFRPAFVDPRESDDDAPFVLGGKDASAWQRVHIRHGEETMLGMFPSMVSIQIEWVDGKLYHICGGSLYAPDKVLTAAHCLVYWGQNDHFAALGVQSIAQGAESYIPVANISIHPDFNAMGRDFPFDIAVLTLEHPADLSSNIQLIQLSNRSFPSFDDFEDCFVAGWGKTEQDVASDSLRYAILKGISNNDCRRFLRVFRYPGLQQFHKCAWGWPNATCQGDSGGPLVCNDLLVGISSWGVRECTGCFPGVYSRVSYHYNWILRQ